MSATNVDLSKAIVTLINAAEDLSLNFTAHRRAVPFSDIAEVKNLSVVVFDGPRAAERTGRVGSPTEFTRTYKPTVAVMKKLDGDDTARLKQADDLQELVEELEELLKGDLAGLSFVGFDEEQETDPYNVEMLKYLGSFAVAMTLQYTDG